MPKNCNLENSINFNLENAKKIDWEHAEKLQFGKFQEFSIWDIPKISQVLQF